MIYNTMLITPSIQHITNLHSQTRCMIYNTMLITPSIQHHVTQSNTLYDIQYNVNYNQYNMTNLHSQTSYHTTSLTYTYNTMLITPSNTLYDIQYNVNYTINTTSTNLHSQTRCMIYNHTTIQC